MTEPANQNLQEKQQILSKEKEILEYKKTEEYKKEYYKHNNSDLADSSDEISIEIN